MSVLLYDCTTKPVVGHQAIILRELLGFGYCSIERLADQLWGHDSDGGSLNCRKTISTHMWRLRPKLISSLRIEAVFGEGYRLVRS